jgi:hypothetical protein
MEILKQSRNVYNFPLVNEGKILTVMHRFRQDLATNGGGDNQERDNLNVKIAQGSI